MRSNQGRLRYNLPVAFHQQVLPSRVWRSGLQIHHHSLYWVSFLGLHLVVEAQMSEVALPFSLFVVECERDFRSSNFDHYPTVASRRASIFVYHHHRSPHRKDCHHQMRRQDRWYASRLVDPVIGVGEKSEMANVSEKKGEVKMGLDGLLKTL